MSTAHRDLTRTTLSVLFILMLIISSLWVLQPFLGALVWATMVVVASWPLMLAVQARLGGRRWLAVVVMTVAMLLVFVVPLTLAVLTIVDHADNFVRWGYLLREFNFSAPPAWVEALPFVGSRLAQLWRDLPGLGAAGTLAKAVPYVGASAQWLVEQAGNIGLLLVQFLLTVVLAAILFTQGEAAAQLVLRFAQRLGGARGDGAVRLAGQAIRGVALGVVVTAVLQALLGGVGLALAGVPLAALLTAIMFVLCVAQIGAAPVMIPAVIWMFWSGELTWGTVLAVWTVVVLTMDNVLRPWLIKKGADLPLLLIFAGVIGGLLSMGVVGIFVGPVVLAVSYTLLQAWVGKEDAPATDAAMAAAVVAPAAAPGAAGAADDGSTAAPRA